MQNGNTPTLYKKSIYVYAAYREQAPGLQFRPMADTLGPSEILCESGNISAKKVCRNSVFVIHYIPI